MVRMEVTQSAAALTKEPRPQPRLRVVDVGRGHIVLARLVAPGAAKHAVVAADGGLVQGSRPPNLFQRPASSCGARTPVRLTAPVQCRAAAGHAVVQQCGGLAAKSAAYHPI